MDRVHAPQFILIDDVFELALKEARLCSKSQKELLPLFGLLDRLSSVMDVPTGVIDDILSFVSEYPACAPYCVGLAMKGSLEGRAIYRKALVESGDFSHAVGFAGKTHEPLSVDELLCVASHMNGDSLSPKIVDSFHAYVNSRAFSEWDTRRIFYALSRKKRVRV